MAMVLDAFMSKMSDLLLQMMQDEVSMLLGVPGEIEKLHETLDYIRCVLADAEKKKNESSAIERWLRELKDVMYDADDVMDLCLIKAQEFVHSSSFSKKGCGFVNLLSCFRNNPEFSLEINTMIREINSRLDEIAKKKANLGLISFPTATGSRLVSRVDTFIKRKSDPLFIREDIVGEKIEEDVGLIVNQLIYQEGAREKVSVVAIVGMGGIGKTTLAKRIFSDTRIKEEFQLKIWSCVSKEAKGVELLKDVISAAGGQYDGTFDRLVLVNSLKDLVRGRKFLLVLDDVWQESQGVWTELLRAPMMIGAQGSWLLVTTRDERVATSMKAVQSHRVEKLSDENGWSLLAKQVFYQYEQSKIQQFKDIGVQLVKKCDGLPLAIKSIGGLLCTKSKTIGAWQAILDNIPWTMHGRPEDVPHAIYLSYEDLPSPLKQCFIACSLYPENTKLNYHSLIYLWIAEGFLHDTVNLWELGETYYRELLQRNLLESTDYLYDQAQCKMHNLLWSFGRYLGKYENLIITKGDGASNRESSSKLRRLSVEEHDDVKLEVGNKEKWLRTLIIHGIREDAILTDLCKNCSNLRILDLSWSQISTIPNSFAVLKHLRYLDFSSSDIKTVPESIGYLRNLVFLDFTGCSELSHIPRSIMNLKKLMHLSLIGTKVVTIPEGLGNLESLIHLYGFKPDNDNSKGFSSLEELETMSQLTCLSLYGLEGVSEISTAKRSKLQSKEKLRLLKLIYTPLSCDDQISQTNEKKVAVEGVLNELSLPFMLDALEIKGYFGNSLPNWFNFMEILPNLRYLYINNCHCFENLVPLGQLPNLDFLKIEDAYSVESVDEEFFGTNIKDCIIPAFPKLNKLVFVGLTNWKQWHWNKGESAMPNLQSLVIVDCPQLRSLPKGLSNYVFSLLYLEISDADCLISIENLPSIQHICVFSCPNLERISNLGSVLKIEIEECPNLKNMENLNESLQSMELFDEEMKVLPEYLRTLMSQKLRIGCSVELLRSIQREINEDEGEIRTMDENEGEIINLGYAYKGGSEWHKLEHIPKVKINTWDDSLYVTYQKSPRTFTANFSSIP